MNKIIYVPGKNPKPPATRHRKQLLHCLLHGVRKHDAGVATAIETASAFSLVAWNYLFYHRHREVNRDIPWIDRLLVQDVRFRGVPTRQRRGVTGSQNCCTRSAMPCTGSSP